MSEPRALRENGEGASWGLVWLYYAAVVALALAGVFTVFTCHRRYDILAKVFWTVPAAVTFRIAGINVSAVLYITLDVLAGLIYYGALLLPSWKILRLAEGRESRSQKTQLFLSAMLVLQGVLLFAHVLLSSSLYRWCILALD